MTNATFAYRIACALLDYATGGSRSVLCDAIDGLTTSLKAHDWIVRRTNQQPEDTTVAELASAIEQHGREC